MAAGEQNSSTVSEKAGRFCYHQGYAVCFGHQLTPKNISKKIISLKFKITRIKRCKTKIKYFICACLGYFKTIKAIYCLFNFPL